MRVAERWIREQLTARGITQVEGSTWSLTEHGERLLTDFARCVAASANLGTVTLAGGWHEPTLTRSIRAFTRALRDGLRSSGAS